MFFSFRFSAAHPNPPAPHPCDTLRGGVPSSFPEVKEDFIRGQGTGLAVLRLLGEGAKAS